MLKPHPAVLFFICALSALAFIPNAARAQGAEPSPVAPDPLQRQHVTVYQEPGRYGGWPANGGIWAWGNEIVVGFTSGWYKPSMGDHAVDRSKPLEKWQARSLDGGQTWSIEKPTAFVGAPTLPKPTTLAQAIDFTAPDFAMAFTFIDKHVGPSRFFISTDRCRNWKGPYVFDVQGITNITARTDYIVLGKHECLVLASAAKADHTEGRPFCAKTDDGGLTWKFLSFIGPEPQSGFAIMPSTVRLKNGELFTTIRLGGAKGPSVIQAYRSQDLGQTWTALGDVTGDIGNSPPSLVLLHDGRLCLTYGYRLMPAGARARISTDEGHTWEKELILRDSALTGDCGYARSIERPDGKVVTIYYFNGPEKDEVRTIQATVWKP